VGEIGEVFRAEGQAVALAAAQTAELRYGHGGIRDAESAAQAVVIANLACWSDGLELGLALAARDMAPAERVLEWIRREVLEDDADARANTEESIAAFLAVLDR
jgi:hypothetical protein